MSDLYGNPNHTLPMPAPSGMPVTYYNSTKMRLDWTLGVDGIYRTQFRSPVFNVRPDLRSAGNSPKFGVPIFNSGARFYVQVSNLLSGVNQSCTNGLRVTSQEYAAINYGDIHQLQPPKVPVPPATASVPATFPGFSSLEVINAPVEITSDFMFGTNQPDRIIVTFAPLGETAPVRFWAIQLNFEKAAADWDATQIIYVESAYY